MSGVSPANIWVQATPGCACVSFLSQRPGAPDPARWVHMKPARLAVAALASAWLTGCAPIPVSETEYRDANVTVTERGVLYYPWPSMVGERAVIKVYGRHYSHVRGGGPSYLEIPGKNALLFVTGPPGGAVVHIVDKTTHKESHIPAYDSDIGENIGRGGQTGWERVETVNGDLLTISAARNESIAVGRDFRYKHFIDLKAPKFIRQEVDYFDRQDQKVRHIVDEGGRHSRAQ